METKLYLDNVEVDLYGSSGIVLNYANGDLDKLLSGTTRGTYSYDIVIPATKETKKLLYFPELILKESYDHTTEKNARVEVGGTVIFNGYARITAVTIENEIVNYSLILFEGNSGWIAKLKDLSIKDIDYSDYDQIYNSVNQINSEVGTPFIAYPYINFGKNFEGNQQWKVEDRYPAFHLKKVFFDILKDAGYSIESEFLNSDPFKSLYFTCDKAPERKKEDLQPHSFRADTNSTFYLAENGVDLYLDTEVVVPFNNITDRDNYQGVTSTFNIADGRFYCHFDGKMSFVWEYAFSSKSNGLLGAFLKAIDCTLRLYRIRGGVFTMLESREITVPKPPSGGDIDFIGVFTSESVKVIDGDVYYFSVTYTTGVPFPAHFQIAGINTFYNKVYSTLTAGATMYVEDNIPDIKQSEFIQDIRTMFNLYFTTNDLTKTITIEPRDSFYRDTAIDWSEKLDKTKPKIITHLGANLGTEIQFKYAEDSSDKYITVVEEITNNKKALLSKSVKITNKNANDNNTIKEVKNFATTYMGAGIQTMQNANIPIIWDSENFAIPEKRLTSWKSRILFYKGRKYSTTELLMYEGINQNYYPEYTTNYSDTFLLRHPNSLDFNTKYYANGLYDKHYRNSIQTINESRKVSMHVYLKPLDILALDFRTPIYIKDGEDGNYYNLEQIHDYSPENNESLQCTFIKIISQTPLSEIRTTDSGLLTTPYIEDEIERPVLPTEIPTIDYMVTSRSVWTSTVDVPTGEFVEVEYIMKMNKLNGDWQVMPPERQIINN